MAVDYFLKTTGDGERKDSKALGEIDLAYSHGVPADGARTLRGGGGAEGADAGLSFRKKHKKRAELSGRAEANT